MQGQNNLRLINTTNNNLYNLRKKRHTNNSILTNFKNNLNKIRSHNNINTYNNNYSTRIKLPTQHLVHDNLINNNYNNNKFSKIPRPTYLYKSNNNRLNTKLNSTSSSASLHRHKDYNNKIIKSVRFRTDYDYTKLRNSVPIISNLPLINVNSSIVVFNRSPFGLSDKRFGILHHSSPSFSYI